MKNGIIEQMQAEIAELKGRVLKLEQFEKKRIYDEVYANYMAQQVDGYIPPPKSPQQIRDAIVAKAKADIELLAYKQSTANGSFMYKVGEKLTISKTVINREKRTIVVILSGQASGTIYAKGIAKADPSDCFNVHIGKAIALRRALGLEVPAEYYNAPAPTEVRVGDVVETSVFDKHIGPVHAIEPRRRTFNGRDAGVEFGAHKDGLTFITDLGGDKYEMWALKTNVKIIDDSRE